MDTLCATEQTTETVFVRSASYADIVDLQTIERSAAQLFKQSSYPELAGFSPVSSLAYGRAFSKQYPVLLAECHANGQAAKAGFAYCVPLEQGLHLQELSVHTDFQRLGIGKTLLEAVIAAAQDRAAAFLSLTTYADIAWNGPFYQRHGFKPLKADQTPDFLQAILDKEILNGANQATRIVMRHSLT